MIGSESKFLIGFDSVESLVLKFIGLKLSDQADAATFLLLIKQNSRAGICNHAQSKFELLATITPQRMEHVTRKTLRVNSHQRRCGVDVTGHYGNRSLRPAGFRIAFAAFKPEDSEVPEFRREISLGALDRLSFGW